MNSYNQDGTLKTDSNEVTTDTLYDIASNTKMYSTNYAIQKLVSDGTIKISDKITKFFPEFVDGENDPIKGKANLTIQNILEHQAGFPADPQYHNNKFNQETQKPDQNVDNPLYSQDKETTKEMILKTPLQYEPGSKTVYSDVDYMLLGLIIEEVTGMDLDDYVENTFYKPLGLKNIVYNPLEKGFEKENIAATELNGNSRDGAISFENIRDYTIQGEVHDEKAYYSMDGVSGHAGLFANAEDLAKLAQVMLNDGGYGNNKFFSKNTIDEFTKRKSSSPTWGLGWWREGDNGRVWYFGTQSSENTIGHQGWTGTLTVIDPESELVVVLLTNKINSPVIDNTKNANTFFGNKFTTATLGTIPTLVYESIIHDNNEALDANVSQMVTENLKLYNPTSYLGEAVLQSVYSKIDTAITIAEERGTEDNLRYAREAVARLDVEKHREQIIIFNERLKKLNLEPVEVPSYEAELSELNELINSTKTIVENGQDIEEGIHYQTTTWNNIVSAYENAVTVANKAEEANKTEILVAIEELSLAKENLVLLNKTELKKAIEAATSKVEDGILEEVEEEIKISFNNVLEIAISVYENKDVTVQDIAKSYNDILVEYKKLGIPVGDINNLADLVRMAEEIDIDRFLSDGKEEFMNALQLANDILVVEDASEIDVYKIYEELYNSMMNLQLKAEKGELCKAIIEAEGIDLDLYTENSKNILVSAIEEAKAIKENEEATEKEVNNALSNLNNARESLVEAADKTELKELVDKAKAIDDSKYTTTSIELLNSEISNAISILENNNLSIGEQEMVTEAINKLNKTIEGLELKESHPGKPGSGVEDEEDKKEDDDSGNGNVNNGTNGGSNNGTSNGGANNNDKLPSTGGNNSIIYVVLGCLVVVSGVILFKKKRLHN